jgi:uncharacterized protein (DUF2126 family)
LKRKLAYDLALRLKQRFAHGGFIHLDKENGILVLFPRWQYALYWRKDGLPLWKMTLCKRRIQNSSDAEKICN